eukprot:GHVH01004830.1.p1 GENE.GHVH01004830.1~~GHVH01004830.1.p1  ORF type:complete len:411 (-),score=48.22 GHVH01004830.1:556-1788(-)
MSGGEMPCARKERLWIELDRVIAEESVVGVSAAIACCNLDVTAIPKGMSMFSSISNIVQYVADPKVTAVSIRRALTDMRALMRPCIGAIETLISLINGNDNLEIFVIADDKVEAVESMENFLSQLTDAEQNVLRTTLTKQLVNQQEFLLKARRDDYLACHPSTIFEEFSEGRPRLIVGPNKTFTGLDDMHCVLIAGDVVCDLPQSLKTVPNQPLFRVEPLINHHSADSVISRLWRTDRRLDQVRSVVGQVVTGFQRGASKLGVPTANLNIVQNIDGFENKAVDRPGIYMGYAWFAVLNEEGRYVKTRQRYPFVMSVGYNPYYENKELTIEPHLLHQFDDDFYGQFLMLEVMTMTRPMSNFLRFDQLVTAIQLDCEQTVPTLNTLAKCQNPPKACDSENIIKQACDEQGCE